MIVAGRLWVIYILLRQFGYKGQSSDLRPYGTDRFEIYRVPKTSLDLQNVLCGFLIFDPGIFLGASEKKKCRKKNKGVILGLGMAATAFVMGRIT